MVLFGTMAYSLVKSLEMKQKHLRKPEVLPLSNVNLDEKKHA